MYGCGGGGGGIGFAALGPGFTGLRRCVKKNRFENQINCNANNNYLIQKST